MNYVPLETMNYGVEYRCTSTRYITVDQVPKNKVDGSSTYFLETAIYLRKHYRDVLISRKPFPHKKFENKSSESMENDEGFVCKISL